MCHIKIHLALAAICSMIIALTHCDAALENLEFSEKCVNIKNCEPVMRLLNVPMIKKKIFGHVRRAQCGREGQDYKIYCDLEKIIPRPERFEPVIAAHSSNYMTTITAAPPPPSPSVLDPVLRSIDKHPNFRLLDHDICGRVPRNYRNQATTRIIGGRATVVDEFPWMALLVYRENNDNDSKPQFRCGGTVINRNHVMTAAHCVTHLQNHYKLTGVRVGEHDLRKEHDCGRNNLCTFKYEDFEIDEVFSHSNYSTDSLQNDIAIIRLKGSIDFARTHVRPICLPVEKDEVLPKRGIVTGWGSTEDDSPGSQMLLKVTLPTVSFESCEDAYSKSRPYIKVWYKQFCAGGYRGMDSCIGDSGGPLQTISKYGSDVRMVQRGIVSYGRRACGMENSLGVYTSVAHYIHWILDRIRASPQSVRV